MRPEAVRAVIAFLKRLILVEFIAVAVYFVAGSLGYYAQWYRQLGLTEFVSFQIAQVLFLFIGQSALIAILFFRWRKRLTADPLPADLVAHAEHERLERKATLRFDLKTATVNRVLEKAALKTVAAFLNGEGGHLLIGVGDNGSAIGLEHDFATLARKDADGWETHFSNLLSAMIGPSFRRHVGVQHFVHAGKMCALISVRRASRPAYLTDEGKEEFFVRTGNGTTALKMSEAHSYIATRFH